MILEIRTYRLKPGTIDDFVSIMRDEVTPLLAAAGIHVVASGASMVSEDGDEEAYLIRAFDSVEQREELEGAFYGSDIWRQGPRESVVSRIESYHTVVLPAATVR
ncbi:NIPSNAP family protein [Actinosynnema sp. ALI-1.44]|uniref:NIPSNAP family protein n=1 Tax=Actinosynnema sp. ALI-1.44 TaxID=1933779 RepID=UPI00097C77B6|nr:NIPSNAP family protein [Actinosynnema sp. ALI-1.44]ONI81713.1 NIPSNAP family protein [Actinosynnema sp. ALI-1.44]